MAVTIGYVQRLTILEGGMACAFIGPSPTNTAALFVAAESGDNASALAWKASVVDGLTVAFANRQQVQVSHADTGSTIFALTLGPG